MLIFIFTLYAVLKFTHLIDKKNPLVAETKETNFYDFNTRVDLNGVGFKMAFSMEGYKDRKNKDDPRYVRLFARMYYKDEGEKS